MTPPKGAGERLRAFALAYPEAREEFPWGEPVVKVRGKVFVFLGGADDGGLSLSVKLPGSATLALDLPFASPTGYGLGKSGWVTARFGARQRPPLPLLGRWIDESYRAVAPKRLSAALDERTAAVASVDAGLVDVLLARFPDLSPEWKTDSARAGRTLRLRRRERTVLYVQPQPGALRVTVVLGGKAIASALESGLTRRLQDAIAAAKVYVEGRPVVVTVRKPADLRDVERLVAFKG
jgi:predicted DNA-binding protein (MmcQ/YjbR family)